MTHPLVICACRAPDTPDNWPQIKGDLDGKVRVTVGRQDNFLLNYAVVLLEAEMKKLDSKFVFTYYPGDHFTVATPQFSKDGAEFLEQKYAEWKAKYVDGKKDL